MTLHNKQLASRIPVGILGATGAVGQRFVQLLSHHPWFEIVALAASDRSAGQPYAECKKGNLACDIPESILSMQVCPCTPNLPCKIVFSGLDASVASEIESQFSDAGYVVISNARNHRFDDNVPLLVPEINSEHLDMIKHRGNDGYIVTNPNCSTVGLVMALKPLDDAFGIKRVHAVTMQAISGAGYPGVSGLDIIDNIVPSIDGEAEKIETETLRILGSLQDGLVRLRDFEISAQTNRVPVIDGHMECVSVEFFRDASEQEILDAWTRFVGPPQEYHLPSAPKRPIVYHSMSHMPQPRLHRNVENGMAVSIGELRRCPVLGWKFTLCVHNTIRGAAGGAVLNAELLNALHLLPFYNE